MNLDKLPIDVVYYIYDFVDYDTKTSVLLNSNKYIMNSRQLREIFTIQRMKNIYEHSINKNLFEVSISRTPVLKNKIDGLFPSPIIYEYVNAYGAEKITTIIHPLKEGVLTFKAKKNLLPKLKGKLLINCINNFRNMKLNNAELDNYFCKIAYLIVRNIVHYRNVIAEKDRQIALKTEEQMTNKINEQNRRTAEKETKRINKINEQNRRTEEKETKRINKINEQNRRTEEKETKRINKINEQNRRTEEKETKRINKKRRDFENRRIKLTKAFEKLYKKKQIATYNSLKIQSKK
jgi:hypothetical protein